MNYTICEMTIDDYDEAVFLWKTTDGIGLSDSDTREGVLSYLQRNPSLSFVARVNEELVGAVLCGHDGRRGYLHHLAVDKRHRRRGIGRALVDACNQGLADLKIKKCNIFLYSNNRDGKAFWENSGWFSRDDLNVMQKVTAEQREVIV